MSRIFISHSSKDNDLAEEVRRRLKEANHEEVFLNFHPEDGIPAGRQWEPEIYQKIRACRALVMVCTEHSMASRWCFAELAYARALEAEVFPLQFRECNLLPTLSEYQITDLRRVENREVGFKRFIDGLGKAGLTWDSSRPPYPGLMVFDDKDAPIYFGRQESLRAFHNLLQPLRHGGAQLVLIVGPSGSGKSSLLRAGILPQLRQADASWLVTKPFIPHDQPFLELAKVLQFSNAEKIAEKLEADPKQLVQRIRDLRDASENKHATVVLSIDQFEQLFAEGGETFLSFLKQAIVPAVPVIVLGTLRSDFLTAFQEHPAIRDIDFVVFTPRPMGPEDFRDIISGPARVAGIVVDKELEDLILADTGTDDALPLLAYTLRQLWDRYGGDGRFTVEEYRDELGGLEESVAGAARAEWDTCEKSGANVDELRDAFLQLVRINEKQQYVKHRVSWHDIPEGAHKCLKGFVKRRLLISGEDDSLEVAHEALFRSWERLNNWLKAEDGFVQKSHRAIDARKRWEDAGYDPSTLLGGGPLAEAELIYERLGPQERNFVHKSIEARDREVERGESMRRLADYRTLEELEARADQLWPSVPEQATAYKQWLKEANQLTEQLSGHEATLKKLQEMALPGGGFNEKEDAWWHDTLAELVRRIKSLKEADHGLIPDIRRRLEFATTIEQRSITDPEVADKWADAIGAIRVHPDYRGLSLEPQLGLVPIGLDPESHLWEFAHLQTGEVPKRDMNGRLALTEKSGLVFVLLPGGHFWMGAQSTDVDGRNYDPEASEEEKPVHMVTLDAFFLSKFQMTQAQWLRVTGYNPSHWNPQRSPEDISLRNPVEQISYSDATNVLHHLDVDLPTEAQWEYACRAGTDSPYSTGFGVKALQGYANIKDRAFAQRFPQLGHHEVDFDDGFSLHAPVGSLLPNEFGLHDMHGNVWEWCKDLFGSYACPARDGDGSRMVREETRTQVYRGGSFAYIAVGSRSAYRRESEPDRRDYVLGVRPSRAIDH